MPHGIFQRISGMQGSVDIPTLGAKIGKITKWSLIAKDETSSLYEFRAEFSYINQALWDDEDYTKEITITLGRSNGRVQQLRVQVANGEETVLIGRSLLMKGVSIHGAD